MARYSQADLLQAVLAPLLDDFTYWFSQSQSLLEQHELIHFTTEQQADLLARVHQTQQEVAAAIALFNATGHQVGVDPDTVGKWHTLVAECWRASMDHRAAQSDEA
ncbi:MAG: DUF2605 domain-containing protein [Elainellaceae cyanobacterium]